MNVMLNQGFPDSSVGKESACNAGDPRLIPGSGRSTGEGIGYPLQYSWSSLGAQLVRNLPIMQETWVCLNYGMWNVCSVMSNSLQLHGLQPTRHLFHGILQARKLEWVAIPPPEDLPDPGIKTSSLAPPALAGGFFTTSATWEALLIQMLVVYSVFQFSKVIHIFWLKIDCKIHGST